MKKIICSAPAKTILSGEHAVVYGKPGLVSALDLRLKFSVWESKKKITEPAIIYLVETVFKYLRKEKIKFFKKSFDYQIDSAIPIGCGLGSSAAFSVAAVAALSKFYTGQEFPKEIINNIAYQGEKYFHKNPSGVDVSASCFGGLIFYRKEFEFLKNITSLGFKIPPKIEEKLYLIDSKRAKESTADMVFKLGKLYNKKPKFTEEILAGIEKTTKKMTVAIIKKDEDFFAQSILENEVFLELLGVVSSKTKKLLEELANWGVGKVTGAGGASFGSGFILFFSKKGKELENFLKQKKINFYQFKQDYRGLVYEN
jgi:mevalonate kinase